MTTNKLILYCFLLLLYLGLSKILSPSELGISYVNDNTDLEKLIPGNPVSAILTDVYSSGFIIKTYYQKYKVIYGFQSYEELIIKTSRNFKEKSLPFLGMSIFRRGKGKTGNFTPLPPGSIFIGNRNFGSWAKHNSGDQVWKFFRVYRQIPKYLGWRDYHPSKQAHATIKIHMERDLPYRGDNDEFGLDGKITRKAFPKYFNRKKPQKTEIKQFLKDYFKENFYK